MRLCAKTSKSHTLYIIIAKADCELPLQHLQSAFTQNDVRYLLSDIVKTRERKV